VSSGKLPRLRKPPLCIEAMSGAFSRPQFLGPIADLHRHGRGRRGDAIYGITDLKPADVNVPIYMTFQHPHPDLAEALGFCAKGDGGAFVEGGARIARDGVLPLNTGGGQLSAGRLHGFGLALGNLHSTLGEGGERQVPGNPQVGITAAGGGPLGGCLLLTRHDSSRIYHDDCNTPRSSIACSGSKRPPKDFRRDP